MFTIENAQLVLKDKDGNVARLKNLGPDDIVKINNAIADIGKLVDPVSHLPIKATATTVGVVQLADDEAIAAGTTGRVVDAKQLQDALLGVSPANCVTNVAAGSTANKIKVTKDGYTTTIVIDNVEHASFANQATHATLADTADISARATKADDATHAAKADEATHAVNADEAGHAVNADAATTAGYADNAGSCAGNAATATNATNDSIGQNIAGTYIKGFSVSGQTVTYTRGDGTTGTFTTQDTNTTYRAGANITLSGTTFSLTRDNVVNALGYTPPAQDTNTTYSAGANLYLSGTQFNVSPTPSFNNVTVANNSSNGILFGNYRVYVG